MQQSPVFSIFQGDAKTMSFKAVNSGCNSDPLDLTACTEIIIYLANQDGTFKQLKLSLAEVVITSPAVLGKFSAAISAIVSAALAVGEFQTFDVAFTIASQTFTVPYINALSVFSRG